MIFLVLLIISAIINFILLYTARKSIYKRLKRIFGDDIKNNTVNSNDIPICYYCNEDVIKLVNFSENKSDNATCPNEFVLPKGIYNVDGNIVELKNEGLYRIMFPMKKNYQFIVYENNLIALLSSIAWVVSHGNADNKLSFDQLCKKAVKDKLYLTCGYIVPFAKKMLENVGYQCRIVNGLSLAEWNSYDNAHVMMEVFHPELNKWILADLDNNYLFQDERGAFLNLAEFKSLLAEDRLKFKKLSKDISTDISGYRTKDGYPYNFYMEMLQSEQLLKDWYKRVMDVIIIEDIFFDDRNIERVVSFSDKYKRLERDNFFRKFYS